MRICLISLDCFSKRTSGLAVYAETLASGLATLGHSVTVVCGQRPGQPAREQTLGVDVWRTPVGRSNWIGFAWNAGPLVARLEQQKPFDVVHFLDVHFAYHYSGPYIASLFQSFRQRQTSRHGLPSYSSVANLLSRIIYYSVARIAFEKPALRHASHLLPSSCATASEFEHHYSTDPSRMTVVPLGIDLSRFGPRGDGALRQELDLTENFVLLYVGFCNPRKGLEYLAHALRNLASETRLVVVGEWDAQYRERFLKALGDARDRVILVGQVPDADLPRYYAMADLFVFPSLLEGFGLPLAEALACGLPVVTTQGSAAPEVVGPGGLLVPPGDSLALEEAIRRLQGDPKLRHHLGTEGRRWVLDRFSMDRMVLDTVEQYIRWGTSGSKR